MNKFEVGDIVVCIDDEDCFTDWNIKRLTYEKTYMVRKSRKNHIIIDDCELWLSECRFIKLSEYRKKKIKSLYE